MREVGMMNQRWIVLAVVVCVACGSDSASPGPTVRAIVISPATTTVALANSTRLAATVSADDGVSTTVSWSSSNPAVASVSGDGLVTGVATGSATISARSTVQPAVSGSAAITVIRGISGVSVSPPAISLSLGSRVVAKATVIGVQGATVSQSVTWETTGGSYFTVAADGTVSGTAAGSGGTLRGRSTVDPSVVSPDVPVSVSSVINSDPCATRVFDLLVPIHGVLTNASCLEPNLGSSGDATYGDWYSYTTTTTSLIGLRTASSSFTPVIAPIATRGSVYSSRSNPSGGDDTVFVLVPAGTTTMFAGTRDRTRVGSYTLDAMLNPVVPSCNVVFTTLGVTGVFSIKTGCGYIPQGFSEYFEYQDFLLAVVAGKTVTVHVTSTQFVPLVEIRGNDGVTSSLGQNQSTVTLTYPATSSGIASIYVTSRTPHQLGTFTITIDR
jgi:hypothetical protein